jgi:H+/Cl- antiporter ClcA/CBS domain-containing protein
MWVLSAVAVVLGVVGGGAAVGLFKLISLMTHLTLLGDVGFDLPTLRGYHPSPMLIPIAVGGGLLVSVFAAWAPVIRGHGIPESLEAILDRDSRIRPRAAVAKPLSAAITIGTGGPFGAEGPIIVTGGSVGSLIGQVLSVSPSERKIMLATGAAAGMSATFNTPIAAVILAIELVLFERSLRVIVPLSIASGIAAAIHVVAFGAQPLFMIAANLHVNLAHLPLFALVGLASGVMAVVLNKGLFAMEAAFRRLPINIFWWPAIGALGFALIGLVVPRTLSMGYSAIIDTLNGHFTVLALAVLLGAKLLSWLIALGSQTSGGTLAPMFLVGATMGCLLGHAVDAIWPAWHVSPTAFALVAMGATFGAATKALFAAVVFAVEVTGEYSMIVPLLIGAGVAELVAEAFLSDRLMTEKLSHRGFRVDFRTSVDALRTRVARQVMREPVWVGSDAPVAQARRVMTRHGLDRLAVVGPDGRYRCLVGAADLDRATGSAALVGDVAGDRVAPIRPDEYLSASLDTFLLHGVEALPVVENGRVVGLLTRTDTMAERYRRGTAQEMRQAGWLATVPWPWCRRRRSDQNGAGAVPVDLSAKVVIRPGLRMPDGRYHACPADGTGAQVAPHARPNGDRGAGGRPGPAVRADPDRPAASGGTVAQQDHSPWESGSVIQYGPRRQDGHAPRRPAHGRLLPDPVQVTPGLGQFVLSERSRIVLAWGSSSARPIAERLAAELRPATGFRLSVSDGRAYRDDICLRIGDVEGLPDAQAGEGYVLTAGVSGVQVVAPTLHGLHNGTQTLRQLLPVWIASRRPVPGPWTMPAVHIVDFPRFGHRGVVLNVSEQGLSPAAIERIVDRIAGYKINRVHLRFSIEHAVRLTAAGAPGHLPRGWRLPDDPDDGARAGQHWTAIEYQHVVRHAVERFVTVVPDIVSASADPGSTGPDVAEVIDRLLAMAPGADQGSDAIRLHECDGGYAIVPAVQSAGAVEPGARVVLAPVAAVDAVADEWGGRNGGGVLGPAYCWNPSDLTGSGRIAGVEAVADAATPQARGAVFPHLLALAEIAWSPSITRSGDGPALTQFAARVAAQGPRLALTGAAFHPVDDVPWRLDLAPLPARTRRRSVSGVLGMLVAPGFDPARLHVAVDWGDGYLGEGVLHPERAGDGAAPWYSITADHEYRRGGAYRVAVTVTGPDAVPVRGSVVLRVGSSGHLRAGGSRRAMGPAVAASPADRPRSRVAGGAPDRSTTVTTPGG